MGVRFLSTYVESRTHLLGQRLELRSDETAEPIPIVTDGFALLHHVVGFTDIVWVHAGDTLAFVHALRYVLGEWQKARLLPIVLWDGTSPPVKLETMLKRSYDRASIIPTLSRASSRLQESMARGSDEYILSPFFYSAAVDCIERLGLEQHFCLEEADTSCGGLAELVNGYVTSQDSDFFLMSMQSRGYIPLSSFIYPKRDPKREDQTAPGDGFVRVGRQRQRYRPDNPQHLSAAFFPSGVLAQHLHIEPDTLPILASLLGNDFVPFEVTKEFKIDRGLGYSRSGQDHFEKRVWTICRLLREHASLLADRHRLVFRLKKIISWLLESQVESERTASVVSLVIESIEQYLLLCPSSYLDKIKVPDRSKLTARQAVLVRRTELQLEDNQSLEPWLRLYLQGHLSFKLLALKKYRQFFYPLVLEDCDPVSAVTVTKGLVQKMVILTFEDSDQELANSLESVLSSVQVFAKGRTVNITTDDQSHRDLLDQIITRPLRSWSKDDRSSCVGKIFDVESGDLDVGVCALRYLVEATSTKVTAWRFCQIEIMAILAAFQVSSFAWRKATSAEHLSKSGPAFSPPSFPLSKRVLHRVGQISMTTYLVELVFQLVQVKDFTALPLAQAHEICQGHILWHFLTFLGRGFDSEAQGLKAIDDLASTFFENGEARRPLFDSLATTVRGLEDRLISSPFVKSGPKKPRSTGRSRKGKTAKTNLINRFDHLGLN